MAYRRRDSARGHSSADAYRSARSQFANRTPSASSAHPPPGAAPAVPSPPSSEEGAHLTSPAHYSPDIERTDSPSPYSDDAQEPLAPPRPFFLGGTRKDSSASSDRNSWNSSSQMADSSDVASDSDRDNTDREQQALTRSTSGGRPKAANSAVNAPVSPSRRRSNTAEFIAPAANANASSTRPRNHTRRRSSSQTPSERNPFDTPTSPTLGGTRAPPSAFPFLSHAGNPDPGTPIPGSLARRASQESFRRLSREISPPNTATGVAYPSAGAGGYAAVRAMGNERSSIDVVDAENEQLGRPYAPFMSNEERRSWSSNGSTPGSSTPPLVYKNSAAAAMTGSSSHLVGGGKFSRSTAKTHKD